MGTTDLLYAYITVWVKTGKFASQFLNYIAGGAMGLEKSMQGGNGAEFLGLFFTTLLRLLSRCFFSGYLSGSRFYLLINTWSGCCMEFS